ncbi:MAG: Glycosyl transferase family 2 [uncultured bacterium]|nr:MAG: Glycosyl transferase family 2 [uncultured bacterium]
MNQFSSLISIIIPCYNCIEFLKKCINSLIMQTYSDFEVIVVNNASSDGLTEWYKNSKSPLKLQMINLNTNIGYAGGVNKGIENANGEIILVLNSDIILNGNFMEEIAKYYVNYEIKNKDSQITHQGLNINGKVLAFRILDKEGLKVESLGIYLSAFLRAKESKSIREDIFPAGAAFAFKKDIISKIKNSHGTLYDERFFFLWEDIELGLRLKKNGIATVLLDTAICYHHGNSTNSNYFYKQYLSMRNRFYVISDYYRNYFIKYFHVVLFYDLPRLVFFLISSPYKKAFFNHIKQKNPFF